MRRRQHRVASSTRSSAPARPRDIGRIDQDAGVADDLRERAAVRGDDRDAERHRLEHRQAEALVERRQHEQRGSCVELARRSFGHVALDDTRPLSGGGLSLAPPTGPPPASAVPPARGGGADGLPLDESPVRRQQDGDVLARLERADEQDVAVGTVAGRCGSGPAIQDGTPGRHTVMRSGGTPSCVSICRFE